MSRPWREAGAELAARWADPLGRSVISLYAIQLSSYVLPLVAFPYLTRVLGPEGLGLYGFLIAFTRVGNLITDWGFSYSTSRDIAQRLERGEPTDAPFSAAMWARLGLLGGWAIVVAVLTTQVDRFAQDAALYWIAFVAVAGSTLFPIWLFQAFERLPLVTGATLLIRVVTTGLLFLLVDSADDIDVAMWLFAAPWVATAAFSLWAARARLGVSWIAQPAGQVVAATREGGSIFITLAAASAYTACNVLLLGLLSDEEQVGYFVAAETVVLAAVGLIGPLAQAIYPRATRTALGGSAAAIGHARAVLPWFLWLGGGLSVTIFVSAPALGRIAFGPEFDRSVPLLQIMSVIPLAIALASVLSTQLMLPLRLDRLYSRAIVAVGIASLGLTFVLVPPLEATGTAISAACAETLIVVLLLLVMRRRGLSLWRDPAGAGAT